MSVMTDSQAGSARIKLAEYEAAKAAEARQAENDRRVAARAALAPAIALRPDVEALIAKAEAIVDDGLPGERGVVDQLRNLIVVASSFIDRADRRLADTEPTPDPEATPAAALAPPTPEA